MFKIMTYGSIVAAGLLGTALTAQAREISVWGNHFTVDDGPAVAPAPLAPRFGATVAHPERYIHLRRLNGFDR